VVEESGWDSQTESLAMSRRRGVVLDERNKILATTWLVYDRVAGKATGFEYL
jgi:hypothetical protein